MATPFFSKNHPILIGLLAIICGVLPNPLILLAPFIMPVGTIFLILVLVLGPYLVHIATNGTAAMPDKFLRRLFNIIWIFSGPAVFSLSLTYIELEWDDTLSILYSLSLVAFYLALAILAWLAIKTTTKSILKLSSYNSKKRSEAMTGFIRQTGWLIFVPLFMVMYHYLWVNNYAIDAAKPLENALVQNGATKICSQGEAGRGPFNPIPSYDSRYQLNLNKVDAEKLLLRIAKENGFSLEHSSNDSIENYADSTTKKSNYPGYSDRHITVHFGLYAEGAEGKASCYKKPGFKIDSSHSALIMTVGLPK